MQNETEQVTLSQTAYKKETVRFKKGASQMSTKSDQVSAMRSRNRKGFVSALQDGRKLRASSIPSARRYNRKQGKQVEE